MIIDKKGEHYGILMMHTQYTAHYIQYKCNIDVFYLKNVYRLPCLINNHLKRIIFFKYTKKFPFTRFNISCKITIIKKILAITDVGHDFNIYLVL